MTIYIISTALSCLFVYLGTRREKRKKKIWIILSIIIPCIVAGARDSTVGTDVEVYLLPLYNYAPYADNVFTYLLVGKAELGFVLLIYILTNLTHSMFWVLFFIELWCMYFTYRALVDNDAGKYTWLGFLVFHLMFYSFTLNLMRQFMSIALGLYLYKYIKQKKSKKYFLYVTLSMIFIHYTSFVYYFIYPLYWICTNTIDDVSIVKRVSKKYKRLLEVLIVVGTCNVVIFASQLMRAIALILGKYQGQVDEIGTFSITWINIFFMLPILFILILFHKNNIRFNPDFGFYIMSILMSTILWQLQGLSRESYRISLYFEYFLILAIPLFMKNITGKNRLIIGSIYTIIMCAYYYSYFVDNLFNETYPYTSSLLGIK